MNINEIINEAGIMYGIILIGFLLVYIAFYRKPDQTQKSSRK